MLGVHRSTISRELRRGSWQPEHDHANLRPYLRNKLNTRNRHERLYLAGPAQLKADTRKRASHRPYRLRSDRLLSWVITHLKRGWSPEAVAGRLRIDFPHDPGMRVSHETLYAWIYGPEQRDRKLWEYLERGQKRRRRRQGRRTQTKRLKWRTSIRERPHEANAREEFGHWESDSVLGARGTGAILTTVERVSRFYVGVKIPQVAAEPTLEAQLATYRQFPAHAVKSVTADNGSEFTFHYRLADTIGVPTYFCDPYSAHQRGSNEHFNRQLRRYLPKGTSFADLTQAELDELLWEINHRPLKVLGWHKPVEVFQELCSK